MKLNKWLLFFSLSASFMASAGQWSAGPVAIMQASPYSGGESGFMFFPGVAYEGEKFKLRGPFADYFVYDNEGSDLSIALTLALGPNQLEVDGDINLAGIEDRDSGLLGGVRFDYDVWGGKASLGLQTDITDESGGHRVTAGWSRSLFNSDPSKWSLSAGVEVEWVSEDYANYYYGVTQQEAMQSAFSFYEVDSLVQPSLTLDGYYFINKKWQFIYNLSWQVLASDVEDSPIVDQSSVVSGVLGIVYLF